MHPYPLPNIFCPRLGREPPAWAAVNHSRVSENYDHALHHFSSTPWTSALLNPPSKPNRPGIETITFSSRGMIPLKSTQDQFMHSTLYHARGVKHMLCFVRTPDIAQLLEPERLVTRIWVLFTLGPGLTSHSGIIHGGMIMTMLDEAMGALHDLNGVLEKTHPAYAAKQNLLGAIDTKFLKPMRVGDVVAESWIESVEDRKIIMSCEIRDQEGSALVKCKGRWIAPRSRL